MSVIASPERSLAKEFGFGSWDIQSYGGSSSNPDLDFSVSNDGHALSLNGNGLKKIALGFNYQISSHTILEFRFKSEEEGLMHGIGFDTDNDVSWNKIFQLYGTQTTTSRTDTAFNDYDESIPGEWKTYQIPVGEFFTGNVSSLIPIKSKDAPK